MMKRISLRNLRISSPPKDSAEDDPQCGGAYEQPTQPTTAKADVFSQQELSRTHRDDIGTPGTVRRKEKKGLFKTLKQKLSVNFKGKRDTPWSHSPCIVDDDSSSDARDEESRHHLRYGLRSPDKYKRNVRANYEVGDGTPGSIGRRRKAPMPDPPSTPERVHTHPTKEELSKSEESTSPSEVDAQAMFPSDAEYGHASAPVTVEDSNLVESQVETVSSMGATQSTVSGSTSSGCCEPAGTSVTCACQLHPQSEAQPQGSSSSSIVSAPTPPSAEQLESIIGYEPYDPDANHMVPARPLVVPLRQDLLSVYNEVKETPKTWSLTKELFKLSKFGWYWGPITRVEAEEKLNHQPDGAFLVRDSSDERYLLSLSFRSHDRTLHTRIEHCNGVFSFYAQPESEGFCSIVELIEHSMSDSQTGVFCYSRARTPGAPSFPVRLTKPLSRFTQVRSLQYLCRFVIRQYTRFDHIQKLPLPSRIKGWLEENQY